MPGYINTYDPVKMTAEVKLSIQWKKTTIDGTWSWEDFALLLDVPLVFPNGGGYSLTFPIAVGDEVLVSFSSRCMDAWWQLGGEGALVARPQAEFRMHDLSDGFAIPGPRSQPRVLPSISTTGVQLRSDDGETYIDIDDGTIKLVAPTEVIVQAPQITLEADTQIDVNAPQINLTADTNVTIDSPAATCTGALTVQGLLTYQAGITGSGGSGASMSGNINLTGSINQSGGQITSNGKVLATHTHGGVTVGGGTTGAPT